MNPLELLISTAFVAFSTAAGAVPVTISPAKLHVATEVSPRFLSYNIEMASIVGAGFWKPYRSLSARQMGSARGALGNLFEERPPLDLYDPMLRRLAAALGPAYVRVSGGWANTVYFADTASPPVTPPGGFKSVLTGTEWKGVLAFVNAVHGRLVTSFAISPGVRGPDGRWTTSQAAQLISFTRAHGGHIAAAEFMNEPNRAGRLLKGYNAADFASDFAIFRAFARRDTPDMKILGPSATGDWLVPQSVPHVPANVPSALSSRALLAATPHARFDVFTYHFYGAVSQRCVPPGTPVSTKSDAALSDEWLDRTQEAYNFYRQLRDRYEPGAPIWITETADAACGGNPWAKTFLDSFRFLNQLGAMSAQHVRVVMHNTLVGSDYGLIDERTLAPRPNYWAALLWKRLMGRKVLQMSATDHAGLRMYAHCLRDVPGGVSLLFLNTSKDEARQIAITAPVRRYLLTAETLQSEVIRLNRRSLALGAGGKLPPLRGQSEPAGVLWLPPASITFLAVRRAENSSCERT